VKEKVKDEGVSPLAFAPLASVTAVQKKEEGEDTFFFKKRSTFPPSGGEIGGVGTLRGMSLGGFGVVGGLLQGGGGGGVTVGGLLQGAGGGGAGTRESGRQARPSSFDSTILSGVAGVCVLSRGCGGSKAAVVKWQ
jgi:hypothetical protein